MLAHIIVMGLTIGSYKKEILDEESNKKIELIEPFVHDFWEKMGYNGVYPNGPNEELWSQVVNGKNYIVKKAFYREPLSLCVNFHESFDGDVSILNTNMCKSVFDILDIN